MEITDEQKMAVDKTLVQVAAWIASRKIDPLSSCLTPDTTDGFNLACDFMSHELRKIREMTKWSKEKGWEAQYAFHKE